MIEKTLFVRKLYMREGKEGLSYPLSELSGNFGNK